MILTRRWKKPLLIFSDLQLQMRRIILKPKQALFQQKLRLPNCDGRFGINDHHASLKNLGHIWYQKKAFYAGSEPGFSFRLFFFFFSLRSDTNRHLVSTAHASLMHAYAFSSQEPTILLACGRNRERAWERATSSPVPSPQRFSKWRIVGRRP